jgi:RHS repeat-associated protein
VGTYTFGAYGDLKGYSGTKTTPFGYAGPYTDAESQLQYLRARYYDAGTQQFLTVDPLVDTTGQPYSYAAGSPLNGVDPSGMKDSACSAPTMRASVMCHPYIPAHRKRTVVDGVVTAVVVAGFVVAGGVLLGVACVALIEVCGAAAAAGSGAGAGASEVFGPGTDEALGTTESAGEATTAAVEGCQGIETGSGALDRIIQTPGGPVRVYGDVTVNGETVTVDVAVYPQSGPDVQAGAGPLKGALDQYARELAAKGYKYLRVVGYRTKTGKWISPRTIDLSEYLP